MPTAGECQPRQLGGRLLSLAAVSHASLHIVRSFRLLLMTLNVVGEWTQMAASIVIMVMQVAVDKRVVSEFLWSDNIVRLCPRHLR